MQIKKFISGPLENNTYALWVENSALVIDPTFESIEEILALLKKNNLRLESILITHSHYDHVSGVAKLKRETNAKILVHELDSKNLEIPGSDGIYLVEKFEKATPDNYLKDGDEIYLGKIKIKVLHTPGHSLGSVCYYFEKENMIFTGDTLFAGTYGYVRTQKLKEVIMSSLKKLSTLPKNTKVYPGHGKETSIEKESWLQNL